MPTIPPTDTINFIWKFNRDEVKHGVELNEKIQLLNQYISKHDFQNRIVKLELYPVERLGLSGSKVFYLDVFYENEQHPERLIAKFHTALRTFQEFKSSILAKQKSMCGEIYSSDKKSPREESKDSLGLIIYKFAKLSHKRAIEFREFYLNNKNSTQECSRILQVLYEQTIHCDPSELTSGSQNKLVSDYNWYIERRSAPLMKLKKLSYGIDSGSEISKKSERILSFYAKLLEDENTYNVKINTLFQHGDLHARNILLDPKNTAIQPSLIDFDWASYAHAGRDFAVLETTIKFMLIREFSSFNGKGIDKHISPLAYVLLEETLCQYKLDLPEYEENLFIKDHSRISKNEKESILRAYECIRIIRINARRFLNCSFKEERPLTIEKEYFIALFLISIGHIAFETSDDYWVLNGCNLLINTIEKMV